MVQVRSRKRLANRRTDQIIVQEQHRRDGACDQEALQRYPDGRGE